MKISVSSGLLRKFLPVASMERVDEIYDCGSAIEVVVPNRFSQRARTLDDHSLFIEDNGEERVLVLPAAVERSSLRIERHGELALLRLQKLPEFAPIGPTVNLPRGAAGVLR